MIKKTFIGCLIVIGLVAFAMGAVSIWLQTEPGIAFATKRVERTLRAFTGVDVEIERLRLTLPLKANIRSITIREGEKTIALGESVRIDIAFLPLLFKQLEVSKLSAALVVVHVPKMEGIQEQWKWPDLPFSFIFHKVAIDNLSIDETTLALSGKAELTQNLAANLNLKFLDPDLGHYTACVEGKKRSEEIHVRLVKQAPTQEGVGALLAAGGILVESFELTGFGKVDSFGAVITGKGGSIEQQILGDFRVDAKISATTDPIAARLIGEHAQLEGVYSIDGTRTLRLAPLRGEGAGISLEGQLVANLNGNIKQGTLTLSLPNLTLLDGLGGLTYSGQLEGMLNVSGTFSLLALILDLSGDELTIQERSIEDLASRITWQQGSGNVSGSAMVAGLPLTITTSLKHENQTWTLPDMTVKGPDALVTGSLTLTEEGLDSFNLEGNITELWTFAPLLKLDVEGSCEFSTEYQNDTLDAHFRAFAFNFQKLALENARVEARLTSPFTLPTGEVSATAERASYRRIAATDVAFTSALGGEEWPFTLEWEGEEEVSGYASGAWKTSKERFFSRWDTFGGMILDEEIRLIEPITVEKLKGKEVTFTPLKLSAGEGTLFLSYDPKALNLEMRAFPLQAAELLLPGLGLVGQANANILLSDLQQGAEGTLAVSVEGVELKESPVTDLGSVYGSFNATLKNTRLDATLTANSTRGSPLKTTLSLPLILTGKPLSITFPAEGALSGRGQFVGELGPLIQFFLPYNMRLLGNVDARVDVSGTAGDPDLTGQLTLSRGLLEDAYSGAQLSDIDAFFKADGSHITLESMSAKAGDGSASATGTLDIDAERDYPLQLDGKLYSAQAVALTIAQVAVSGDLILSGPFLTPTFSGNLTTDRAHINLPKRFSTTGLPNLEVTYINLPPSKREIVRKTQPVNIGFDLTVEVPNNLEVRGRGVRATLGGKIDIAGTIERPSLMGDLTLKKGEFTFGAKTFNLTEGLIAFSGPPEDHTRIDVSGSIRVSDVEVGATISGLLPNVKLTLFSNPPMTDREILSYLLFDSPASLIGAGQALQLAAASSEVAGGNFGPGLLTSLPKTVGLDGLTISSPAGNSEELGIQATKRISPDFDVNIYKSINSASNHLIIEFNFFREFAFRAERVEETDDEPGADRLSLRWRRDY